MPVSNNRTRQARGISVALLVTVIAAALPGLASAARSPSPPEREALTSAFRHDHRGGRAGIVTEKVSTVGAGWARVTWITVGKPARAAAHGKIIYLHSEYRLRGGRKHPKARAAKTPPPPAVRRDLDSPVLAHLIYQGAGTELGSRTETTTSDCSIAEAGQLTITRTAASNASFRWSADLAFDPEAVASALRNGGYEVPFSVQNASGGDAATLTFTESQSTDCGDPGNYGPAGQHTNGCRYTGSISGPGSIGRQLSSGGYASASAKLILPLPIADAQGARTSTCGSASEEALFDHRYVTMAFFLPLLGVAGPHDDYGADFRPHAFTIADATFPEQRNPTLHMGDDSGVCKGFDPSALAAANGTGSCSDTLNVHGTLERR